MIRVAEGGARIKIKVDDLPTESTGEIVVRRMAGENGVPRQLRRQGRERRLELPQSGLEATQPLIESPGMLGPCRLHGVGDGAGLKQGEIRIEPGMPVDALVGVLDAAAPMTVGRRFELDETILEPIKEVIEEYGFFD